MYPTLLLNLFNKQSMVKRKTLTADCHCQNANTVENVKIAHTDPNKLFLEELTLGKCLSFRSKSGKMPKQAICITIFEVGAGRWTLWSLLSWMRREWADHTYSLTPSETLIVLYVNKGFQHTVGQRLKCTMGGTFSEQPFTVKHRVQRTCWKNCQQY